MSRKGFTLVELMMVVTILSVLMGIVTTAAVASLRSSREKRRDAMQYSLQAAIATFHAQDSEGKWPGSIESLAKNGDTKVLSAAESQDVFQEVVKMSVKKSGGVPLIDANGLFVAPSGVQDGRGYGMSFTEARKKDARHQQLSVSKMVFGYQGKMTGKFHRYTVIYNSATDSAKVSACCEQCCGINGCTKDGKNGNELCPICHKGEE